MQKEFKPIASKVYQIKSPVNVHSAQKVICWCLGGLRGVQCHPNTHACMNHPRTTHHN